MLFHTACDSVLTDESGTITSPNYPGTYPSQSDCTIYVSVPQASSMQVTFNFFELESNYDFLYYGVGQNNDLNRAIGSLSGTTLPDPIDFRVGVVWFRFTSDGSVQYNGFSLTYTATIGMLSSIFIIRCPQAFCPISNLTWMIDKFKWLMHRNGPEWPISC